MTLDHQTAAHATLFNGTQISMGDDLLTEMLSALDVLATRPVIDDVEITHITDRAGEVIWSHPNETLVALAAA